MKKIIIVSSAIMFFTLCSCGVATPPDAPTYGNYSVSSYPVGYNYNYPSYYWGTGSLATYNYTYSLEDVGTYHKGGYYGIYGHRNPGVKDCPPAVIIQAAPPTYKKPLPRRKKHN